MRLPILLVLVLATQPFANGRWTVPIVAWLAPILLLRLLRTSPGWRGLGVGWLIFTVGWAVQWWDIVSLPRPWFALAALGCGSTGFLPYCIDRWLSRRIPGFASTLVLPTAQVSVEWILATATPNGTWGALAYTQSGDLPLMQLASITGIYGLSFLIAWAASSANFVWDHRQWPPLALRATAIFAGVLMLVLIFGGARLALPDSEGPSVRVATIAPNEDRAHDPALGLGALEELFRRSSDEASAGAKVILWPEDSFFVFKSQEPAVLDRARRLARKYQVHLGMAYGARLGEDSPRYENKFVLVTPTGEIAWEYLKNHPVPGRELATIVRGTQGLALLETADGHHYAGAICYDGDFPGLFRRAGKAGTQVLFLPADDWRAIDPLHTRMSVFRGIEQGASVVRPTMRGLSIATNHKGEVLATSDWFADPHHTLTASVPLRHVRTIYSLVGDLFAWLCLAVLVALAARARPWTRST